MKRLLAVFVFVLVAVVAVSAQTAMEKTLMTMEKQAWDAFGKGDGKFFETFLADDALILDDKGFTSKAQTVKDVSAKPCVIKSYSFSNFKVTMLNPTTALATYEATQDATCGTQAMPAKVFASSIYVKRKGKWQAAFHQETPAM